MVAVTGIIFYLPITPVLELKEANEKHKSVRNAYKNSALCFYLYINIF
jgi:hypothetical protein